MSKTIKHKVKVYTYLLARIEVNLDSKATIAEQVKVQSDHAMGGREMEQYMVDNGYQDYMVVSCDSVIQVYEMTKEEFMRHAIPVQSEEV